MSKSTQKGFSYIDVMIAVTIMMVGLMGLCAALVGGIVTTGELESQMRAQEYAASTIEAIYSVRDISKLGFPAAQNVTPSQGATPGIFPNGRRSILPNAGLDGIVATADDTGTPVEGFERQLVIKRPDGSDVSEYDSLRQVDVTIFYKVRGTERQLTISAYIGNYRQVN